MGLQGHVGSAHDTQRIRQQEKQREEERKRFEELKKQSEENVRKAGLREFGKATTEVLRAVACACARWHAPPPQALENAFKAETVGLVTREEFVEKRKTLAERLEQEAAEKKRLADEAERQVRVARTTCCKTRTHTITQDKIRRKRQKAALSQKSKLSFLGDDDEDEEQQEPADDDAPVGNNGHLANNAADPEGATDTPRLGKDPTVATEFLPDKDREAVRSLIHALFLVVGCVCVAVACCIRLLYCTTSLLGCGCTSCVCPMTACIPEDS